MIPVFAANLFNFLIFKFTPVGYEGDPKNPKPDSCGTCLTASTYEYVNNFTFWNFLNQTLFLIWLFTENNFFFNPPVRTMPYELWGSFFSFFLAIIVINIKRPYVFFFLTIAILSVFMVNTAVDLYGTMNTFAIGGLFAFYFTDNNNATQKIKRFIRIVWPLREALGIFLYIEGMKIGSYVEYKPGWLVYVYNFLHYDLHNATYSNLFGGVITFLGVLQSGYLQYIL